MKIRTYIQNLQDDSEISNVIGEAVPYSNMRSVALYIVLTSVPHMQCLEGYPHAGGLTQHPPPW